MNNITLAQREALDVVKDMLDKSNTNVPEYGTKIMTLILGILNIDCRVEHTDIDITNITDIKGDSTMPINPNNSNDKLQIPDWIKNVPTPPFVPRDVSHPDPCPFPPRVWYNQEPEPIQTNSQEERRYATEVSCTGDKTCITTTRYPNDCVTYTGDFRDGQISFNDK
jgi:hypothetical protein